MGLTRLSAHDFRTCEDKLSGPRALDVLMAFNYLRTSVLDMTTFSNVSSGIILGRGGKL